MSEKMLEVPSLELLEAELKKELADHPVIKALAETFDASLLRCIQEDRLHPTAPAGSCRPAKHARNTTKKKEGASHAQYE